MFAVVLGNKKARSQAAGTYRYHLPFTAADATDAYAAVEHDSNKAGFREPFRLKWKGGVGDDKSRMRCLLLFNIGALGGTTELSFFGKFFFLG